MVFEDVANIAVICGLLGLGVAVTVALLFGYLAALVFMEDSLD
jgi:hypothetical protein